MFPMKETARLFQVDGARVHEWLTFQERVAGVGPAVPFAVGKKTYKFFFLHNCERPFSFLSFPWSTLMKMQDHNRSKGILVLALALCAALATIVLLAEEDNLPSPDSLPPHYKFLLRQTNVREQQLEAEVQRLKAKLVKSEATTKGAGQPSGPLPPGHETNGVTHHKALSDYERSCALCFSKDVHKNATPFL